MSNMNNKKVKSVIKEFESDYYKLQEDLKKQKEAEKQKIIKKKKKKLEEKKDDLQDIKKDMNLRKLQIENTINKNDTLEEEIVQEKNNLKFYTKIKSDYY